jgi:hypothetical protein
MKFALFLIFLTLLTTFTITTIATPPPFPELLDKRQSSCDFGGDFACSNYFIYLFFFYFL